MTAGRNPVVWSYRPGSKPNGSVSAFLRHYKRGAARAGVAVDCAGCNACCRTAFIQVELTEAERDRLGGVLDQNLQQWVLPKNDDGSCSKLIDGKCSIYSDRPWVCRTFDCRVQLLLGWMNRDDQVMAEALQAWAPFRFSTPEDHDIYVAIRLAIVAGGMPARFDEVAEKASRWQQYIATARMIRQRMAGLTESQRQQLVDAIKPEMAT